MVRIAVIGCGVVGAMIAYELSQVPETEITVIDRSIPASGSTGAALGVLMGVISQKVKGRAWEMRSASLRRYETLIPELEHHTGQVIPFNRQGILMLCFAKEDLAGWETLAHTRHQQGYSLDILTPEELQQHYPQIQHPEVVGAIYSPCDRQLDPTALTQALVTAATHQGVAFQFNTPVDRFAIQDSLVKQIQTPHESLEVDWVVVAAGTGSLLLTAALAHPIEVRPVLGQAIQVHLDRPLGHPHRQPVISGQDVHLVPIGPGKYWVGATVEFPQGTEIPVAEAASLEAVIQQAIGFCPDLAQGTIAKTWSGLRPRPVGRPAPVIEPLSGYNNVLLATGHYRNGVLLAPATAQAIRQAIVG
ncbi:MAG: FAD-dependent oxidoreductase [Leptolyngbyaceae cyanobacterium bins.59]|nr:FAD-dependent oxidoreductase [Leptolyngbyaceae cyanobacterium bins.59]